MDNLRKKWRFSFNQLNIPHARLIGLIVFFVLLAIVPLVMHNPYRLHLFIIIIMNTVLAMTFILLLRTGLITLAISAFWGIGAYASALLVTRLDFSFWFALPLSTIITGIVALIFGYLFVVHSGFSFVILTLAFGMAMVLVFGTFDFFGGHVGIMRIPPPDPITIPFLASIEFNSKTPFYYLILFLALLVILAFSAFYTTWTGRAWKAIGLSPRLAESLGINLFKYRLLAFVIASTTAGLMGSFYAHYFGGITPPAFSILKTINVQMYAILGGIGYAVAGPLVGTIIMTFIPEFLRATSELEPLITGLLLILLVIFLPDGLLGLLNFRKSNTALIEKMKLRSKYFKPSLPIDQLNQKMRK